jgi:hypothetical protein
LETFGKGIVEELKGVVEQAVVWNTRKQGRPDLVKMAWEMYKEEGAEAVFVLSNKKLTKKVVYGMESRSVPALGPFGTRDEMGSVGIRKRRQSSVLELCRLHIEV